MKKFAAIAVLAFALGSVVNMGYAQAAGEKPKVEQAKPDEKPPVVSTETRQTIQILILQFENATKSIESAEKTKQLVQLQMEKIVASLQVEGWDLNPQTFEYTKKK